MKFKLLTNKNVLAILTASALINAPNAANIKPNMVAYYQDGYYNIHENNLYTLSISRKQLEALINLEYENLIEIKIGDEIINIDKKELLELKEMAERSKTEERELSALIISIGGIAGTTIYIKDKIKEKIKEK